MIAFFGKIIEKHLVFLGGGTQPMFNKDKFQTIRFIWLQITIIVMCVCITIAAILFGKPTILFWYIAPVLLQIAAAPKETVEND